MKAIRCAFVVVLLSGLLLIGGCLSAAQKQRIEELSLQNIALVEKQRALVEKVRLGTATPEEMAEAFTGIAELMKKNAEEIEAIKESGSTGAWLAAAAGLFGRTLLHAAGAAIPGGNAVSLALQGLITVLLGGSTTVKPKSPAAPTT